MICVSEMDGPPRWDATIFVAPYSHPSQPGSTISPPDNSLGNVDNNGAHCWLQGTRIQVSEHSSYALAPRLPYATHRLSFRPH
jgi:hypothetical protein